MPFLFVLLSLLAGAVVGWLSVLAGIWFTTPIFIICAAIVSISLGREFRWRLAAFSVGLFATLALQASTFVREIETQQKIQKVKGQEIEQKQQEKARATSQAQQLPPSP